MLTCYSLEDSSVFQGSPVRWPRSVLTAPTSMLQVMMSSLSIYGSLDITLDQMGLKAAKELKAILDLTLAEMEKTKLPEHIAVVKPETVKNPFA